jgi:asparagine N-glycosylation enzyme membrane subunit Stt3
MVSSSSLNKDRFVRICLILSLIILGIIVRVSNYRDVFANFVGHLNFYDPDSYFQLRRLAYFLQNFPKTMLFDPLSAWPEGTMVHWSPAFVWIYGGILKIFSVDTYRSLELGASFLSILSGLGLGYFAYKLTFRLSKNYSLALLSLLFFMVGGAYVRHSCLGQVDHHILEAYFSLATLFFSIAWLQDEKRKYACLVGLHLGLGLLLTPACLFNLAAVAVSLLFFKPKFLLQTFLLCFVPASLYAAVAFNQATLNPVLHISPFHLSLIAASFGGVWLRWWRPKYFVVGVFLGLLLLAGELLFSWRFPLLSSFADSIRYLFGASILQNVIEAQPLFFRFGVLDWHFPFSNLGYLAFLAPLAPFALFRWKRMSREMQIFFVFLIFFMFIGLVQKRFTHYLAGPFFIGLSLLMGALMSLMKEKGLRISWTLPLVFISCMAFPMMKYGFAPGLGQSHQVDLTILTTFSKLAKDDFSDSWERLGQSEAPEWGIWSNPNMGHMLSYVTGRGVLTDSFYHYKAFKRDFSLRTQESDEELHKLAKDLKLKYLFVLNDVQYFNALHRSLGKDDSYLMIRNESDPNAMVYDLGMLERFAWFRLLVKEDEKELFEEIIRVHVPANHFYNQARIYKHSGFD